MKVFFFCLTNFVLFTIILPIFADEEPYGDVCGKNELFSYFLQYDYEVEEIEVPPGVVLIIPKTSISSIGFTSFFSQYTYDGSTTFYGFSSMSGEKELFYSVTYPPNEQDMGPCSGLVNIEDFSIAITGQYRKVTIRTTSEGTCNMSPPSGAIPIGSPVHIDNGIFKFDLAVYVKDGRILVRQCFSVGSVLYVAVEYGTV